MRRGRFLNILTVYSLAGLLFFERFNLGWGVSSYDLIKVPMVVVLWKLVEDRKRLLNSKIFLLTLVYLLVNIVSANLSLFREQSTSEVFRLTMWVMVGWFLALETSNVGLRRLSVWMTGLVLASSFFRLWLVVGGEDGRGGRVVNWLVDEAMWLSFDYHWRNLRQIMFLSSAHLFWPVILIGGWGWWMMLLVLVSIFLANSRTYLVITVMTTGLVFLLGLVKNRLKNILLILGVMLAALMVSSGWLGTDPWRRLRETDWISLSGRKKLAEETKWLGSQRRWFGVGQGVVPRWFESRPEVWNQDYARHLTKLGMSPELAAPSSSHSFINIKLETGLIGWWVWLLIVGGCLVMDVGYWRKKHDKWYLVWTLVFWGSVMAMITDVPSYPETAAFWMVRGVLVSYYMVK